MLGDRDVGLGSVEQSFWFWVYGVNLCEQNMGFFSYVAGNFDKLLVEKQCPASHFLGEKVGADPPSQTSTI